MKTIDATWKQTGKFKTVVPQTGQCPISKKICYKVRLGCKVTHKCPHFKSHYSYPGGFSHVYCECPNSVSFIRSEK